MGNDDDYYHPADAIFDYYIIIIRVFLWKGLKLMTKKPSSLKSINFIDHIIVFYSAKSN